METGRRGLLSQATLGPAPNLGFGRFLSSAAAQACKAKHYVFASAQRSVVYIV